MPGLRLNRTSRGRSRSGSVAIMFALALLPLAMVVGLAIDYSFYVSSRAQLNLAADAAAMHAVRIASSTSSSADAGITAGVNAGQQWFAAQTGLIANASVPTQGLSVKVTYATSPSTYTATVSYNGTVPTHFASLFGLGSWPISGTATSVISNAYVEVLMLLDNSPSMLLGSTNSDILALEQATVCPTMGRATAIAMGNYVWNYPANNPPYGWSSGDAVPPATPVGSCDSRYDGSPNLCFYPMSSPNIDPVSGLCTNGGGAQSPSGGGSSYPQTPCGFACHSDAGNNDYLGIARSLGITLRLDVVQQAAANVIAAMVTDQQTPNQFSVGVYQFSNALQQVYPAAGEASNNLTSAQTVVQNIKNTPPLTTDLPLTNFQAAATTLAALVTNGGNGSSPSAPQKNLFIVTDGMDDTSANGQLSGQTLGPMTSATNETICQQFKNKGFAVYVLYIPYLPIPVQSYLSIGKPVAEPTNTSPNVQALQACATTSAYFFQASNPGAIQQAMVAMLQSALDTAGRISH